MTVPILSESPSPPLVSIILTTYNRANYLSQAVQTVLAQTYPHWELWVIDDGSTDETAAYFAKNSDDRVEYVYQENQGACVARNEGLRRSQGKYLALLDDDDFYLPHKLARQVAFLEEHPETDLVSSGTLIVNADGDTLRTWQTWLEQPQLTLANCLWSCPLPVHTLLFRRNLLDRLDHWFDPTIYLADTDFLLRLLLAGGRFDWLPEVVGAYRFHATNSLRVGARLSGAFPELLEKFWQQKTVPAQIRSQEVNLYLHYTLIGACYAYFARQPQTAHHLLAQCTQWQSDFEHLTPSLLTVLETIVSFAQSPIVEQPAFYIRYVFSHLPPTWSHWRNQEHTALSMLYMGRVFKAQAHHQTPHLQDWLAGVWYAPRQWLPNRGVWSILVRDIVGHW